MTTPPAQDDILEPLPERERHGISLAGLLVGFIVGLVAGLGYTWQIDPVIVRNAAPSDLQAADKQAYIIAAAGEYAASQDLEQVVVRLLEVEPERNPFEVAAEAACELIRSGQVDDVSDIQVIRSLRSVYEPQGVLAPCDVTAFNTPVPVTIIPPTPTATFTPSITPVATKTPTQAFNPEPLNTPIATSTTFAQEDAAFRESYSEAYCDPNNSGIIEVYVRDTNSVGLPGIAVEVTSNEREKAVFYTGLKPERGDDYADFQMEAGKRYRVAVLNEGQPSQELEAVPCDEAGTITSYRVVLQRFFNQ